MRSVWLKLAVPIAALACASAPAHVPDKGSAEPQRRSQCFWPSQVSGFGDAGPDKALVNLGAKATWEITLSPGCPDVNYAMNIGIRARGGGRICSGSDAELFVPEASGSSARRCLVRNVRKLSPEEMAAARGLSPRRDR